MLTSSRPDYRARANYAYIVARREFIKQCADLNMPCAWCGGAIDYTNRANANRNAPTCDHIRELWQGGTNNDPANWAIMHKGCNTLKSNKTRRNPHAWRYARNKPRLRTATSRQW